MLFLKRTFLRGLSVVLPLLLTIYVLYWLASLAEKSLCQRGEPVQHIDREY